MTAPIRLATSRERPAVKACCTCAYERRVGFTERVCGAVHNDCTMVRLYDVSPCGPEGRLWEPRPPRRSLARWIYDTFLKIGDAR